jgi:hypothetical protein
MQPQHSKRNVKAEPFFKGAVTLIRMTFSLMTPSIMTLSMKGLFATFGLTKLCHYAECHHAECCVLLLLF